MNPPHTHNIFMLKIEVKNFDDLTVCLCAVHLFLLYLNCNVFELAATLDIECIVGFREKKNKRCGFTQPETVRVLIKINNKLFECRVGMCVFEI